MDEIVFFKQQIACLESLGPQSVAKETMHIIDRLADGVPVKVIEKKSSENDTLPLMVYFHGSGYVLNYGSNLILLFF
jgi:acetyl esterase/lipase